MEYKIIHKKPFEKMEAFEKRINSMAISGWRVITSYAGGGYLILGKEKY